MSKQYGQWVSLKDKPLVNGWYMVRGKDETRSAMYFRVEKRSYGDSQWFVNSGTGYSWQGLLPTEWLKLEGV